MGPVRMHVADMGLSMLWAPYERICRQQGRHRSLALHTKTLKIHQPALKTSKANVLLCFLFYGTPKLRESPRRRLDFDVVVHAVEVSLFCV